MASGTHKVQTLVRRSGNFRSRDPVAAGVTRAQLLRMVATGDLVCVDLANGNAAHAFGSLAGSPVDLLVGSDGALCVLARNVVTSVASP